MGTTADKLQRLVEGKQAIVDAVNSKANTSLTINSKLSDVASAINNISGGSGVNLLQKQIDEHTAMGLFAQWGFNTSLDEYINYLDFSRTHLTCNMFEGCQNLKSIPFFNTSNIIDMAYMFSECVRLTSIPQLDTSKVTNMNYMFNSCQKLTTIPQLDTSNVTDMYSMFDGCKALTTIPQLDTSKVTNMYYMFDGCESLITIPQLDTSSVTNMRFMFSSCESLTTIPQLDTSSVTNMGYMFYYCPALKTIDITYYNISSTTNVAYFARNCTSLKSLIIRSFGTSYALSTNSFTDSGIANGTGYIYVPRAMVDTLSQSTNWSTYASQIRALEDYTIDGTTTGALDENKI